jgi:hypothetical protein
LFHDFWEWFQTHWTSYEESRISYPIQNLVELIVFKILGLMGLQHFHWILSHMRVCDWHLIKRNKPFTPMLVVLIVELLCHGLSQNVPLTQTKIID